MCPARTCMCIPIQEAPRGPKRPPRGSQGSLLIPLDPPKGEYPLELAGQISVVIFSKITQRIQDAQDNAAHLDSHPCMCPARAQREPACAYRSKRPQEAPRGLESNQSPLVMSTQSPLVMSNPSPLYTTRGGSYTTGGSRVALGGSWVALGGLGSLLGSSWVALGRLLGRSWDL